MASTFLDNNTRQYPRTFLDAFPNDRAEYACAVERPLPTPPAPWRTILILVVAYIALASYYHVNAPKAPPRPGPAAEETEAPASPPATAASPRGRT